MLTHEGLPDTAAAELVELIRAIVDDRPSYGFRAKQQNATVKRLDSFVASRLAKTGTLGEGAHLRRREARPRV